jgi:shikimate dehydrogenase
MYPEIQKRPIDISKFPRLCGIIDAVYNPLRTELVCDGIDRGIPSEGGLYMLVAQGICASEIFFDVKYPEQIYESLYNKLLRECENIVLIGMPSSGKTTVGRLVSERLNRTFIDTDLAVEEMTGKQIPVIFNEDGEESFRDAEALAILKASSSVGTVIATGGGSILRKENRRALSMNGRIYFIDTPPEKLLPTSDRPLSSTRADIEKRYNERYGIYCELCNVKVPNEQSANDAAELIIADFNFG